MIAFYFYKQMTRNEKIYVQPRTTFSGDLVESIESVANLISKNSGVREYRTSQQDCYDADCPFKQSTYTRIRITSDQCLISQIGEAFLSIKAKIKISSNTAFTDDVGVNRLFIGYKNSNEAIRQIEVFNNNNDTKYISQNCIQENTSYSCFKPRSSKVIHKYVHSLYENTQKYDNSVAGAYVDPSVSFASANTPVEIPIELIIPINDLLALQVFSDWPAKLYGDIVLKLHMAMESLVVCQVDPHVVAEYNNLIYGSLTDANYAKIQALQFKYDRKFVQVGSSINVISDIEDTAGVYSYTASDVILTCHDIEFTEFRCTIPGYNVDNDSISYLANRFTPENPWIIPSQQIELINMPKPTNDSSYDQNVTYALHNVTDFILVFPKTGQERTCFENPMIQNLQLVIDNKLIPVNPISTMGPVFFTLTLQAADLDGLFECTQEFEDSLTKSLNDSNGTKIVRTYADQTSCIIPMQAERKGKGFFFDGMDTGNRNVTLRLRFNPIYSGAQDTYLYTSPAAPQLWLCRDTYWTYDNVNGLHYESEGTPKKYTGIMG